MDAGRPRPESGNTPSTINEMYHEIADRVNLEHLDLHKLRCYNNGAAYHKARQPNYIKSRTIMNIENYGRGVATEEIMKWRSEGKKAFGIVCCHVPFELLHAAGIFPVRLRATGCTEYSSGEALLGDQNCGFTKSVLQRLVDGTYDLDGFVSSNGCQIASGVYTQWSLFCKKQGREQFMMQLDPPRMCNQSSENYFRWDLEDLQKALEEYTGEEITNEKLRCSVDVYNEARRLVKQVYDLHKSEIPAVTGEESLRLTLAATEMPVEDYIVFLKEFLAQAKSRKPVKNWPVRVMVAGSALDDPEYVRAIEDYGCLVVADMNSFGLRFLRDEIIYDENDVLGSLTKYYLNRSSCPRMIDGSDALHEYVLNAVKEYSVDGVILEKLSFCDKWKTEVAVLEDVLKQAGIPSLTLERQEQMSAQGQLGIRVEAFREMLENKKL